MAIDKYFPLVSTQWLYDNLDNENICIIDASWHMPAANRNGRKEYESAHIKGAVYFDIDGISDKSSDLPHMVPNIEFFAHKVGDLGIKNDTKIIVYDSLGIFTAPRVWWHFRHMGHTNVFVLDGGLKKWLAEGRAITNEITQTKSAEFTPIQNPNIIKSFEQVLNHVNLCDMQILDARSMPRFLGEEAEPRAGLKSGHIKGSKNVHFAQLINPDGTMKSNAELINIFQEKQIDIEEPIITSCGSGVTACIIALALACINAKNVAVYDGSWSEWGAREGAIIAKGQI